MRLDRLVFHLFVAVCYVPRLFLLLLLLPALGRSTRVFDFRQGAVPILCTPMERCDIRIEVATVDALVGSIGSDLMNCTVMGDVAKLATRLEGPLHPTGAHTPDQSARTVYRVPPT
ncbi:hypothetical protein ABIA06_002077 [Bradyrhizobium yuanmingense]